MADQRSPSDETRGPPSRLPEVRSMENILLETSPIDESIDLSVSREDALQEGHAPVPESPLEALDREENSLEQYFSMEPAEDDIFSSIAASNGGAAGHGDDDAGGDPRPEDEQGEEEVDTSRRPPAATAAAGLRLDIAKAFDPNEDEILHIGSVPKSADAEAMPVAFEEQKGAGIKPAYSTKSLSKFFTEDAGGNDTEGKSFFESFTAAEGEEALGTSPRPPSLFEPRLSTSSSIGSPGADGSSSFDFQRQLSTEAAPVVKASGKVAGEEVKPFELAEDPFSASLNMSDIDRRHDAWLPSEMTRQVLVSMVTSPPGGMQTQPEYQTLPGLVIDDPLGDPVSELVHKFMGEQEASKRVTLTAGSVAQDETGVRQLISAECHRAAVDLTGRLLTQCGQGMDKANKPGTRHTPYTLQLWFTRIALLLKLRQYTHAESEMLAFGSLDKPDLYYEYYPDKYAGRRGSMVPFSFRVLHAELPQHLGKTQDSLDRLYYLYAVVKKILTNLESGLAEDGSMLQINNESRKASRDLWESREIRLLYSVGNCLVNIKDFAGAVSVFEDLMKKEERNKANLLSGIGRIHLQMGDVIQGMEYFEMAEKLDDSKPESQCRNWMNKGFVSLGQNLFAAAHKNFSSAVAVAPDNAVAINNMAVCSLYMGQLKDAITSLETLVHRNPNAYLHDGILFNLCTLYELESSRAMHKKQTLLDLVSKHKGNGFNVACLKMA